MRLIRLYGKSPNNFAMIDEEDYMYLNQFKWYLHKSKSSIHVSRKEFIGIYNKKYKYKTILMHREILKCNEDFNKIQVDHINGNGLDNRKTNLRLATPSQNRRNLNKLKSNNTSKYRGVSFRKENGKFRARVMSDSGKRISIGDFDTAEEAAKAFDKAAKEHYGEYCGKLNFE